jgi:hypothetical protein
MALLCDGCNNRRYMGAMTQGNAASGTHHLIMAGLDPAILCGRRQEDARVEPGHDEFAATC